MRGGWRSGRGPTAGPSWLVMRARRRDCSCPRSPAPRSLSPCFCFSNSPGLPVPVRIFLQGAVLGAQPAVVGVGGRRDGCESERRRARGEERGTHSDAAAVSRLAARARARARPYSGRPSPSHPRHAPDDDGQAAGDNILVYRLEGARGRAGRGRGGRVGGDASHVPILSGQAPGGVDASGGGLAKGKAGRAPFTCRQRCANGCGRTPGSTVKRFPGGGGGRWWRGWALGRAARRRGAGERESAL